MTENINELTRELQLLKEEKETRLQLATEVRHLQNVIETYKASAETSEVISILKYMHVLLLAAVNIHCFCLRNSPLIYSGNWTIHGQN
jgi:hypothetical protein